MLLKNFLVGLATFTAVASALPVLGTSTYCLPIEFTTHKIFLVKDHYKPPGTCKPKGDDPNGDDPNGVYRRDLIGKSALAVPEPGCLLKRTGDTSSCC